MVERKKIVGIIINRAYLTTGILKCWKQYYVRTIWRAGARARGTDVTLEISSSCNMNTSVRGCVSRTDVECGKGQPAKLPERIAIILCCLPRLLREGVAQRVILHGLPRWLLLYRSRVPMKYVHRLRCALCDKFGNLKRLRHGMVLNADRVRAYVLTRLRDWKRHNIVIYYPLTVWTCKNNAYCIHASRPLLQASHGQARVYKARF